MRSWFTLCRPGTFTAGGAVQDHDRRGALGARVSRFISGLTALTVLALAPALRAQDACPDRSELRQAYFGDLHVHTGVSADAMLFGTTNRPDDAYRFARGQRVELKQTHGTAAPIQARIARPLDFAAVTDHAENLGAMSLCTTPGSPVYDSAGCRLVRTPLSRESMAEFSEQLGQIFQTLYTSEEICGKDRQRCRAAARAPWHEIQAAAERWNDPCAFTAFIGYEYSPTPEGSKLHHNVIFRGRSVMEAPISWLDAPSMIDFWRQLRSGCRQAGTGCDVLAIPHNPNLGNGRMFALDYGGETDPARQREIARLRAEIEPVVEIFQQKGDSECRQGLWKVLGQADPFCGFEKYRDWQGAVHEDCRDGQGAGAMQNRGCVSRLDYARHALAAGLAEQRRIGANPHRFGVIGSTDAHDGSAGDVDEWIHDGVQRQPMVIEPGRMSPGGLAGVWARENTREEIFDAMRRREIFATSGPRMSVRLFAGWELADDVCGDPGMLERAYRDGVPMGAELPYQEDPRGPRFLVSALADPGTADHPGTQLQRAQIVKVWAGEGDELHQAVHDVAGGDTGASVDPLSCERSGPGSHALCGIWRDPDYDPAQGAAYYARVIENPSCRHSAHACRRAAAEGRTRPAYCSGQGVPMQVQERAWSSPIWLAPAPATPPGPRELREDADGNGSRLAGPGSRVPVRR